MGYKNRCEYCGCSFGVSGTRLNYKSVVGDGYCIKCVSSIPPEYIPYYQRDKYLRIKKEKENDI